MYNKKVIYLGKSELFWCNLLVVENVVSGV